MPKVGISHRLPIDTYTAEIIQAQQARVRASYADIATTALALFPAVMKNPRGVKSCGVDFFERHFSAWIDSLAEFLGPGGEPYDRTDIVIYSFRHAYAQRHADSGTPIEVRAEPDACPVSPMINSPMSLPPWVAVLGPSVLPPTCGRSHASPM